jgi:hypothetical protein
VSAMQPGERKTCEACGKAMVGGLTMKGKVAPIEVEPSGTGNVLLQRHADGTVAAITFGNDTAQALRERGVELRLNHFATCPERERFNTNEGTGT